MNHEAGNDAVKVRPEEKRSGTLLRGEVESLGPRNAWGWVAWQGRRPPAIAVRCGDLEVDANASWVARLDLSTEIAGSQRLPGFQFRLPYEVELRLLAEPALAAECRVLVDGEPLPFAHGVAALAIEPEEWTPFPLETSMVVGDARHPFYAWLETPFRVRCRLEGCEVPRAQFALVCNGRVIDAVVTAVAEKLPATAGSEQDSAAMVFECEFPGNIWTHVDDGDRLSIQFRLAGVLVPAVPVQLSLQQARAWIEQQVKSGPHDTYDQLLALEHTAVVGKRFDFDESIATYFEWAARNHGLDELAATIARPETTLREMPAESNFGSMLVWQALRDFNDRLPGWQGREEQLLASVEKILPVGEQRASLYTAVLPLFCRIGRFEAIRQRVPATLVDSLSWSQDVYSASLSLPFLVADGKIDRASEILYAIAGEQGWLACEALAVASRMAALQTRAQPGSEKFAYAVIGLLDKLAPDYWSRLHDEQLVASLVAWLEEPVYWNQWLWRDIVGAALRVYGLSPGFWDLAAPLLDAGDPLHDELREGREHFRRLRAALEGWTTSTPASGATGAALAEALAYFARVKNHEYPTLLRELVASRLVAVDDTAAAAAGLPLQELLGLAGEELVRLAALPVVNDASLLARAPSLCARLAQMFTHLPRSPRYALQCRIGETSRQLACCDDAAAPALLATLLRDVEALDAAGGESLPFDLLARAWRRFSHLPAAAPMLSVLANHAMQGLQAWGDWPPQPLLTGLLQFRAGVMRRPGGVAETYLKQFEVQLEQRFRERHEAIAQALAMPVEPAVRAPEECDTLVVVYSCRKYLDTRIAAIRETWLKDLVARGIPYVVLVGDGDGTLQGDVLALDVSDRYEDLPAKSLAMVHWVAKNTDFQYLVKVDDDCLLNVDAYFGSLSYRKFHYYGRILQRAKGATDRTWHQEKSQGARAKAAIDKSPEPSIYADGGAGYSLSRLAMLQVLAQAETPWGQRLVASSFMEDKLVGDLLNWARFKVANEDYYTLVRRRFGSDPVPVSVWDNNFAPSLDSPAKLAHLDTPADMAPVRDGIGRRGLWPKKLWPTHAQPAVTLNSNQLELVTPPAKARELLANDLFVVAVMRNEEVMLPHFLAHYRRLGVRAFIIVDNLSDDGTRAQLLAEPDVVLYSADTEYRLSTFGVAWQQAVLAHHCIGKWALVADADELLVYPGCETKSLPALVAELEAGGHDAAQVFMVDMYPYGDLSEADFTRAEPFDAAPWFDARPVVEWRLTSGSYGNASNHVSALRHRLMPTAEPHAFTTQKFCLVRYAPWMRFCAGLHNVANAHVAATPVFFAHFKYHAGFAKKVEQEVARKQHYADAQEYRKYMALLAEGRGQFGVEGVSCRYEDSHSFLAAMNGDKGGR